MAAAAARAATASVATSHAATGGAAARRQCRATGEREGSRSRSRAESALPAPAPRSSSGNHMDATAGAVESPQPARSGVAGSAPKCCPCASPRRQAESAAADDDATHAATIAASAAPDGPNHPRDSHTLCPPAAKTHVAQRDPPYARLTVRSCAFSVLYSCGLKRGSCARKWWQGTRGGEADCTSAAAGPGAVACAVLTARAAVSARRRRGPRRGRPRDAPRSAGCRSRRT